MNDETAYDVVNRQSGQIVGTVYMANDEFVRFEPQPAPELDKTQEDLFRVVWWQSMVQGMTGGETLEADVPREKVQERVMHWRISLAGAVGVMVDACPMSFVPAGDHREDDESAEGEGTR